MFFFFFFPPSSRVWILRPGTLIVNPEKENNMASLVSSQRKNIASFGYAVVFAANFYSMIIWSVWSVQFYFPFFDWLNLLRTKALDR